MVVCVGGPAAADASGAAARPSTRMMFNVALYSKSFESPPEWRPTLSGPLTCLPSYVERSTWHITLRSDHLVHLRSTMGDV